MSECALKKFKIDLLSAENVVDSATQKIIKNWLTRDDVRNSNIEEASISIMHNGYDSMFLQTSNPDWTHTYFKSGIYEQGDQLTSSIYFDDNNKLLKEVIMKMWSACQSIKVVSFRLNYLRENYDNYRNLGGFSLGYFDPIRNNRVYVAFIINTIKPIMRETIPSLYKAVKELYLELLPYAMSAMMNRNFKDTNKYKNILAQNTNEQYQFFKDLKQEPNKFNNQCTVRFI